MYKHRRSVTWGSAAIWAALVVNGLTADRAGDRLQPRHRTQKSSLAQAVSDRAQLHTIAFSGLAFLSGDHGAATFLPPGKACDFFGFQYMRDIDAAEKGYNPMFLNRVAGNVLHVLTPSQRQRFMDLAEEQAPQLEELARMRLPLIKAFYLERDRETPGLNQAAVVKWVGDIFAKDAARSIRRAEVMAEVAASLTANQKAYLEKMKFGDFASWPALDQRDQLSRGSRGRSKLFHVAYMTYASEFFSWTAGSIEADTYFCPERHGTYFGGFYMKDMPAMGKRDFDISTSITGDSGRTLIAELVTENQTRHIRALSELQRDALAEIVEVRGEFSRELRKLLAGETPDRAKLLRLGRRYGELDGKMSWLYTMGFAKVNRTLTEMQRTALCQLRNLDGYRSAPYYIYSRGASDELDFSTVEATFFPEGT